MKITSLSARIYRVFSEKRSPCWSPAAHFLATHAAEKFRCVDTKVRMAALTFEDSSSRVVVMDYIVIM